DEQIAAAIEIDAERRVADWAMGRIREVAEHRTRHGERIDLEHQTIDVISDKDGSVRQCRRRPCRSGWTLRRIGEVIDHRADSGFRIDLDQRGLMRSGVVNTGDIKKVAGVEHRWRRRWGRWWRSGRNVGDTERAAGNRSL